MHVSLTGSLVHQLGAGVIKGLALLVTGNWQLASEIPV